MRRAIFVLLALAVFAAACGGDDTAGDETAPNGVDASMAELGQWDLVVFADRNFTPENMADAYAQRITADTGVAVEAQDFALTGLESERILAMIRDEAFPNLGEAIAGAEVVVVNGTPPSIDLGPCLGGSVRDRGDVPAYTADDFAPYVEVLGEIYDEIFRLRDGAPTIVRAMDFYNPWLDVWQESGVAEACTAAWERFSAAAAEAAQQAGVPFVSMYDLLNGPDHLQDMREAGYLAGAMWQASETAGDLMTDALAATGYAPVAPPGG
jgi:hypothetical protein